MTVTELLQPLDKYRMHYVKVYTGSSLHIFNLNDDLHSFYRWFGNCRVKLWRADLGDSLYIEI